MQRVIIMAEGERIAKQIAAAGICSRRDAERLITEGRVRVNGKTITSPALNVTPHDTIEIDGEILKKNKSTTPRVWAMHKPAGYLTTTYDPQGRPTVFDLLPPNLPRLITIGRLDYDSEGLLLFTTSGALARAMELPKNQLPRTYRVRVNGQITEKHLHMLSRGVTIEGERFRPIQVVPDTEKTTGRNRWLSVTLTEGKNREIRRVFEYYGYPVSRLIRVGYAGVELGDLKPGNIAPVAEAKTAALAKRLKVL
jgi:23S rRNA pseudouridine2605 synthase